MLKNRWIKILGSLSLLGLWGLLQPAKAEDSFGRIVVSVSGNFQQTTFKPGFGDNVVKRNYRQPEGFLGFKLNDYFSLEGGYRHGLKVKKSSTLENGDVLFGVAMGGTNQISTQFALGGGYLNITANLPLSEQYGLGLVGTIGLAWTKLQLLGTLQGLVVKNIKFQTHRWIPRAGIGIQAMFTDQFGWRAMGLWDRNSVFKDIKRADVPTSSMRVKLRDSFGVGLGVVYYFD